MPYGIGSPEDDFAYGIGIPKDATWRNLLPAAEVGLSLAPGSGEAMSARDAWDASGRAGAALERGEYGNAMSEYMATLLASLGVIPGAGVIARGTKRGAAWMDRNLPEGFNRLLDAVYPQGYVPDDTAFAIPAWHGSPHNFDKFQLDKIGTGEGNQAFGHGLYFAENPAVARDYQSKLSGGNKGYLYDTELDVEPEDLLDWDLPLSQQPEHIRKLLEETQPGLADEYARAFSSGQILPDRDIPVERYVMQPGVSEKLREAGIPGIRYLDQGSRDVIPDLYVDGNIVNDEAGYIAMNALRSSNNKDESIRYLQSIKPRMVENAQPNFDKAISYLQNHEFELRYPPRTSNYVIFDDSLVRIRAKHKPK